MTGGGGECPPWCEVPALGLTPCQLLEQEHWFAAVMDRLMAEAGNDVALVKLF